jgi:hypothetical protein
MIRTVGELRKALDKFRDDVPLEGHVTDSRDVDPWFVVRSVGYILGSAVLDLERDSDD